MKRGMIGEEGGGGRGRRETVRLLGRMQCGGSTVVSLSLGLGKSVFFRIEKRMVIWQWVR